MKKAVISSSCNVSGGTKRKRLDVGKKVQQVDVDQIVMGWITSRRERALIMKKAQVTYQSQNIRWIGGDRGSRGWLEQFMRRHRLYLRRKMSVTQKDPELLIAKLISYVLHVTRLQKKINYRPCNIIARHPLIRQKNITLKTTGNENSRFSVCLATKADGRKLKPMVILKGSQREVGKLIEE